MRLVGSDLADAFFRSYDKMFVGSTAGLYFFHKWRSIGSLKELSETTRYTPAGSDLKQLLQAVQTVLPAFRQSPDIVEIKDKRTQIKAFLEANDERIAQSLSTAELKKLLAPVGLSPQAWLTAGKRNLFPWQRA